MPSPTTNEVIDALMARLTAAQWTPAGGDPEPAFGVVAFYEDENPARALAGLLANRNQRVAALYYEGQDWETTALSLNLCQQHPLWLFTLYFADRHWSGRDPRATRGGEGFPGAHELQDIVADALAGPLLPRAMCAKENMRFLALNEADDKGRPKDPLSRKAIALQLRVLGGWVVNKNVPQPA
jgi:hypothetical protein